MISYMKRVLSDSERKAIPVLVKEALHCLIIERELPYYYFTSLLYKKNADNYRHYIGFRKIYKIINNYFYAKTNGRNYNLEDKLLFDAILTKNEIPTTKIFANNTGNNLTLSDGTNVEIQNAEHLQSYLIEFLEKSASKSIFIKPVDGVGGKNTYKLNSVSGFKGAEIYEAMKEIKFVFQETVIQHETINRLYPESINTIRIHSHYDRANDKVQIVSALMRFGSGGSVVDNGSSGGMFVPVSLHDWSLTGKSKSYLNQGGKSHAAHPDTNIVFDGFKIPFGDKIESIIDSAARLFESDFIGWDIAITDKGPIIIEGNDCPHLIMAQMGCGGFKNHPVYNDIFKEYI